MRLAGHGGGGRGEKRDECVLDGDTDFERHKPATRRCIQKGASSNRCFHFGTGRPRQSPSSVSRQEKDQRNRWRPAASDLQTRLPSYRSLIWQSSQSHVVPFSPMSYCMQSALSLRLSARRICTGSIRISRGAIISELTISPRRPLPVLSSHPAVIYTSRSHLTTHTLASSSHTSTSNMAVQLTNPATGKQISVQTGLFINNQFVPSVDSKETIEYVALLWRYSFHSLTDI